MPGSLRRWLAGSDLLAFNQVRRDAWVRGEAARLPAGSRVLDVGAGSCPYRDAFAHCDYKTQDYAPLHPDQLRDAGYGRIDYVCDAAAIPVPDGSFDAVLCTEMLEHVPDPARVVHELARVLRPGGRLILTAPLGSGIHQEPYHFYGGYTPYWYERFLPEAGFRGLRVEANAGSLRFFGQESIRFLQLTAPRGMRAPLALRLCWAPFWILLVPVLGFAVPLAARILDRFDAERRFTVGYFVTAERAG
jgi:SAM-dependent methyltransferase